jgi:hypothetical protein
MVNSRELNILVVTEPVHALVLLCSAVMVKINLF